MHRYHAVKRGGRDEKLSAEPSSCAIYIEKKSKIITVNRLVQSQHYYGQY